jgi:hypothetical protein
MECRRYGRLGKVCTVVVSLAPGDAVPLLLLGVRDEFTGRPWQPPARHWPGSPLIGGLDEQAGGTWLAVHPDVPRVACILNGRGQAAPPHLRRSRGELPLRAAEDKAEAKAEAEEKAEAAAAASSYDPFHLVRADRAAVTVTSWDGRQARRIRLSEGTHILTNAGYAARDPKAERFGPRFAARRPSGDPAASLEDAWGDWLTLAAGDGLPPADEAAIIARRELPDGRVWGTTSVTLVALAADGTFRYDFQAVPGAWKSITT